MKQRRSSHFPHRAEMRGGVLFVAGRRRLVSAVLVLMAAGAAWLAWYVRDAWIVWPVACAAMIALVATVDVASTGSSLRYEVRGDRLTVRRSGFGTVSEFRGSGRDALRFEARVSDHDGGDPFFTLHLLAVTPSGVVDFMIGSIAVPEPTASAHIEAWEDVLGLEHRRDTLKRDVPARGSRGAR